MSVIMFFLPWLPIFFCSAVKVNLLQQGCRRSEGQVGYVALTLILDSRLSFPFLTNPDMIIPLQHP
jgi:hypothetical protein